MPEARRVLPAPWRDRYMRMLAEVACASDEPAIEGSSGCFLRDYWLSPEQDEQNLVVVRRADAADDPPTAPTGGMILMNLYPYASGHLLVALGQSRPRLLDYEPAQRAALWRLVEDALALMERALAPQGVNVGLNQGRAAGAGAPQHAHWHVVPRWHGDVNFMTTIADIRVIPTAADAMARRLREAWTSLGHGEVNT